MLAAGYLPLGIRGEWEWGKIEPPPWPEPLPALLCAAGYVAFVVLIERRLSVARPWFRRLALAALVPAGFIVQMALQQPGGDWASLAKWPFVLFFPGSSGYYSAARSEVRDVR